MKKRELVFENQRLKQERNELSKQIAQQESDLVRLRLIPDKYVTTTGFGFTYIDWGQIDQDLKDLETYEAAERGRKIAGDGDGAIHVSIDAERIIQTAADIDRFINNARRAKPRKPWLDAKNGEAWVIDVDGYPEPLAVIVDDTRFETHLAAINKTDPRITAGHRIWPEAGGDK